MTFNVTAQDYARFMGRYAEPLAPLFADEASVRAGQRALDVGCGPGALTAQLVQRLGVDRVSAIEPSAPFVEALRADFPGIDVRSGVAEDLPFADATFDVVLANLVVHFMSDPVAGLAQMARVARSGAAVGATVWDHAGGSGPLAVFWQAVHDVDPRSPGEAGLAGTAAGQLEELFAAVGLSDIRPSKLTVHVSYASFDEWWEPFTLGVGPAGAYLGRQDDAQRALVRQRCLELMPAAPFEVSASAWCVIGSAAT